MQFIIDFYSDGKKLIGLAAPLLSLLVTLAKAFDLDIQFIRELSYAWAFSPLLVWVFAAYFSRWQMFNQILNEYDNCLHLFSIETLNAVDTSQTHCAYVVRLDFKNTCGKPVKYEFSKIAVNGALQTDLNNLGTTIPALTNASYYTPDLPLNLFANVRADFDIEYYYGPPSKPKMRRVHKKFRLEKNRFLYDLDEDVLVD